MGYFFGKTSQRSAAGLLPFRSGWRLVLLRGRFQSGVPRALRRFCGAWDFTKQNGYFGISWIDISCTHFLAFRIWCTHIYIYMYTFIHIYIYTYIYIYMYIYISTHIYIYTYIYIYIYIYIYYTYIYIMRYIYILYVYIYIIRISIYLSNLSIYLSVCLSIYLSIAIHTYIWAFSQECLVSQFQWSTPRRPCGGCWRWHWRWRHFGALVAFDLTKMLGIAIEKVGFSPAILGGAGLRKTIGTWRFSQPPWGFHGI